MNKDQLSWQEFFKKSQGRKSIPKKINDFNGREKEVFEIFEKHQNNNLHKMKPIPVCKIPDKLK